MIQSPSPLGLHLPAIEKSIAEGPFLHIKEMESWVGGLPIANVGECARQTYTALHTANRAAMANPHRLRCLELLRPVVRFLTDTLSQHYTNRAFPLPERSHQVAELTRELNAEMAIGYKRIVEGLLADPDVKIDIKEMATAIERAMRYLAQTLLTAHQIYTVPHTHVWLEMHHLYWFAEHNDIHKTVIQDALDKETPNHSIDADYKGTLLFALANPYRLMQRDIGKTYELSMHWAQHCQLHPCAEAELPRGLFVVDLTQDAGPAAYRDGAVQGSSWRAIDTSHLIKILKDQNPFSLRARLWKRGEDEKIPAHVMDLMSRLATLWGAIPKRGFSRMGHNHHTRMVLGLQAVHETLQDNTQQTAFATQATFSVAPAPSDFAHPLDIWDIAEGATAPPPPPAQDPSPPPQSPTQTQQLACYITNESPGGCRIVWKNGEATQASVGMLIGVFHDRDGTPQWHIGAVRWMMTVSRHDIILGVEFLSSEALAAAVRTTGTNARAVGLTRALWIPAGQSAKFAQTVIVPPQFREGDRVEIKLSERNFSCTLARLIEHNGGFLQFEIQQESQRADPVHPTGDAAATPPAQVFDKLWTTL